MKGKCSLMQSDRTFLFEFMHCKVEKVVFLPLRKCSTSCLTSGYDDDVSLFGLAKNTQIILLLLVERELKISGCCN